MHKQQAIQAGARHCGPDEVHKYNAILRYFRLFSSQSCQWVTAPLAHWQNGPERLVDMCQFRSCVITTTALHKFNGEDCLAVLAAKT